MVILDGLLGKDIGIVLSGFIGVGDVTVVAGGIIFKENCPVGSVLDISVLILKALFKVVSLEVGTFMEIVIGWY